MNIPVSQRPPRNVSPWANNTWKAFMSSYVFETYEALAFGRALTWFDQSDELRREADALRGRDRDGKLKAAAVASTVALRHWKLLRFKAPARPARRPGRPPGKAWPAAAMMGDRHADG